MDPGPWDSDGEQMALGQSAIKAVWDKKYKHLVDEHTMNRALVKRAMHHLDPNAVQSFQHELQLDQNE